MAPWPWMILLLTCLACCWFRAVNSWCTWSVVHLVESDLVLPLGVTARISSWPTLMVKPCRWMSSRRKSDRIAITRRYRLLRIRRTISARCATFEEARTGLQNCKSLLDNTGASMLSYASPLAFGTQGASELPNVNDYRLHVPDHMSRTIQGYTTVSAASPVQITFEEKDCYSIEDVVCDENPAIHLPRQ
eukprot:6157221-Amphidinium_carterae.1